MIFFYQKTFQLIINVIYLQMCYWRQTLKVQKFMNDFIDLHFNVFIWTKFVPSKFLCRYLQSTFVFLLMFYLPTALKFIMVDFWWMNFTVRRKPNSLTSNNLFVGHSRQDWLVELDWWCLLLGKRIWIVQWKKYYELNSDCKNFFTF